MPTPPDLLIPRNLRFLKSRAHVTWKEVAAAVGVKERQVYDWASDKESNPRIENLEKLSKVFGVSMGYFLNDNPESRGA